MQAADEVAKQLLVLGSNCSLFRSFLLRQVLSEVGGVAEQLWEAQQVSDSCWYPQVNQVEVWCEEEPHTNLTHTYTHTAPGFWSI